ncbi:MAG: YbdK family carboxylate-amine ligase [Miltoncostaeaceae bacterium]
MGDPIDPAAGILAGVRERFEASTDFTVGLEEEFQILDPATLRLTGRFEEMMAAAEPELAPHLAGELIASEIEYRTGRNTSFADAARELVDGRLATIALAERLGLVLGITGVHPFSPWTEQRIIDTEHYRRLQDELGYVAWTNNTWSVHIHVGLRGADRAMAICTALRSVLPELLAVSANSPLFAGRDTRLDSARVQVFTKSFPRCGVPDAYPDWDSYARHVGLLERTRSIVTATQIWWSVRPHHNFGTVEVRICDGQTDMAEALAVAALAMACVAGFAADHDAGRPLPVHERGLIEENIWRAQRHGVRGELIDLDAGTTRPVARAVDALVRWSREPAESLGLAPFLAPLDAMLRENGAMRQRRIFDAEPDLRVVHSEAVARTKASAIELRDRLAVGAP